MSDSSLREILRAALSEDDLSLLAGRASSRPEAGYEAAVRSVIRSIPDLEHEVARSRRSAESRCRDIVDLPAGRLHTLFANSRPSLIAAIAWALIRRSFDERFRDPDRSLRFAEIALQAATELRRHRYLAEDLQQDLEAEACIYLANARRLNGDLRGAEQAFEKAAACREAGSGDRELEATHCFLEGALRFSQGRSNEAARLFDTEIRLRRLLDDDEALGHALINRGVVAAWSGTVREACDFLLGGAARTENEDYLALSLHPLAERLARDERPLLAWKVICTADMVAALIGTRDHDLRSSWIKGIIYRAFGELAASAYELSRVRDELLREGRAFKAALASLDLAAVRVAQGKLGEVRVLAEEALAVFRSEGVEPRALAAFLVFYEAVKADRLTAELAASVANFLARAQHDRRLSFADWQSS